MPVPNDWGTGETIDIKNNAVDGKIETIVILNAGDGYQPIGTTFNNVPILGDRNWWKSFCYSKLRVKFLM